MTVEQVGRTTNSVTINVSGITKGDRQTSVWIPDKADYFTLQTAKANGYISDFYVVDLVQNNGDITIELPYSYYKEFKTVDIKVENVSGSTVYAGARITAVLAFKYEGTASKRTGEDIDITVNDMKAINKFGAYIGAWIGGDDGWHYYLDGVGVGDKIFADYLRKPAEHILNAALTNTRYLSSGYYNYICSCTQDIVDNVKSGADFKASYFNNIYTAITAFNMSITVTT